MDDGESHGYSRSRKLGILFFLLLMQSNERVNSIDTEIELMRQGRLEKYDISIFVEEKVQYIHSRIALGSLFQGIEYSSKLSSEFGSKASTPLGKILNSKVKVIVSKIDKKLREVYGDNKIELKKSKRAIEFVGNLISKLFGNPGPEEWKQNNKNIIAMKKAIEKQLENSILLHHDIDQNRHKINEQNEILNRVTKEVFRNENRIDKVDNSLTEFESYLELESMINSIIDILETMSDIKNDAKNGRCNE